MIIIVDTREQKVLFKNKCRKQCLYVGDYTTELLYNKFHIERKSLQDLYGTVTKGHVRFRNEIIRAVSNDIKMVMYVEGTLKDFAAKKFPGGQQRKITGNTLKKIIETVSKIYKLDIVWCLNRIDCKNKVLKRLQLEETNFKRYGKKIFKIAA